MKVYEIGTHGEDDNCDCTIWIASKHEIKITDEGERSGMYVTETDMTPDVSGIDFIIK
jgi:hypothetical protein